MKMQRPGYKQKATRLFLALLAVWALLALNGCEKRGEVKPLWVAPLPFHFLESYNVADGVVVAFGADKEFYRETEELRGTLIGLDSQTGNKLWQQPIDPARRYLQQGSISGGSFIVVGEGLICFRDLKNALHALDRHTGTEKWRAKDVLAILTVADGQVFVVDAQKKLAALDSKSGAVEKVIDLSWKNEIVACTRLQIADEREYLAVDGVVTAKDRTSGKQSWSSELKTEGVEMLATQGFLIVASLDTFAVFDGASGKKLWQFTTTNEATLPAIEGDTAYTQLDAQGEYHPGGGVTRGFKLRSGEKVLEVAASGAMSNGMLYDLERADHYDPTSKLFVNDYHWRDSSDVRLVARDLKTGARLWTAEPWCWGWIEDKSVVDNVVYAPHLTMLGAEPVRLLAYRAGRSAQ